MDALVLAFAGEVRTRLAVEFVACEPVPHWHDLPVLDRDGVIHFPGTALALDADVLSRYGIEIPLVVDSRRLGRVVIRLRQTAAATGADRRWLAARASDLAEALARLEARDDIRAR